MTGAADLALPGGAQMVDQVSERRRVAVLSGQVDRRFRGRAASLCSPTAYSLQLQVCAADASTSAGVRISRCCLFG
jgi:hypothetical protein